MASKSARSILFVSVLLNAFLLFILTVCYYKSDTPSVPTSSCPLDPSERPYIFIGGVPSSGTTLMRVILDAHPDIRCGEETRLVPRILQMKERWRKGKKEHKRLDEAGLNNTVINLIVRNFISNVIEYHGPPAKNLCNKDPLSLIHTKDLHFMFPRAKFVLVVRDGRAVAYSIVSRNLTISGVDNKSYLSAAAFWNRVLERMWENCKYVGPDVCHVVFFEKLVSEPKNEINNLLKFLGIDWHDNVLKHSQLINKEVKLSKYAIIILSIFI